MRCIIVNPAATEKTLKAFKSESHLRMSFYVPEEIINKAFDRRENYF